MIKIKVIAMILLLLGSIAINGEEKPRKIKVNGSASIVVDAEFAEVSIRIHAYGTDFEANTKKIQKTISEIEKSLNTFEIKEGSYLIPIIEHNLGGVSLKISSSKTGGSSSNENGYSNCTITLTVLKLDNLGLMYKEISKIEGASVVSTQLKINNEENLRLNQYKMALLAAKRKGDLMATTLNAKLGVPLLIEELNGQKGVPNDGIIRAYPEKNPDKNNFAKITIVADVYVEFQLD